MIWRFIAMRAAQSKLNADLAAIISWLNVNKLTLNVAKSMFVIIGSNSKLSHFNNINRRNDIITVRGQDYHSYNTCSKEIIRTAKSVTNWGLLRSFNSVLAHWNDLSPTTKKLSLRDFKNVLRKTLM